MRITIILVGILIFSFGEYLHSQEHSAEKEASSSGVEGGAVFLGESKDILDRMLAVFDKPYQLWKEEYKEKDKVIRTTYLIFAGNGEVTRSTNGDTTTYTYQNPVITFIEMGNGASFVEFCPSFAITVELIDGKPNLNCSHKNSAVFDSFDLGKILLEKKKIDLHKEKPNYKFPFQKE